MPGDALYKKAEKALEGGNPEEALAICQKITNDVDAAALAVECLAELGRWPEAEKAAARVLGEDPQWATGYLVQGFAAIERADRKAAKALLEKAWKEDATLVDAPLTLSTLADLEGDFKQGDHWLELARKEDGEIPAPFHLNAVAFDELLLEAVDQFPKNSSDTLDESHFRVVPMPSAQDIANGTGIGDGWRIEDLDPAGDPPTFSLTFFQRNLERGAAAPQDISSQIEEAITEALSDLAELAQKMEDEDDGGNEDEAEDDGELEGYGEDPDEDEDEDDEEPVRKQGGRGTPKKKSR
jgi:tetratricopeptide (TPR) repeat protein